MGIRLFGFDPIHSDILFIPADAEDLSADGPVDLVFSDAGHNSNTDAPETVNRLIERVISSL